MNRTNHHLSKESPNVSTTSTNGNNSSRISSSLMNGNGQLVYRRSPIPATTAPNSISSSATTANNINNNNNNNINHHHHHQLHSYDTSISTSYNSEEIGDGGGTSNCSFEEDNITDLSLKFEQLQRQVEVLTETQSTQDERYKRSRQENDTLLNKIHNLEDQLRELEVSSEVRAKEDEKRFRETMAKQMKIQSHECEQHLHANFLLQQDLFKVKDDLLKSESLIKTLRSEKEQLELELQEKTSELISLDEEVHKLKLLVKNLKDEEKVKSNLISILNEELEDSHNRSQLDQSVASSSSSSSSPKQRSTSSRRSSVTNGLDDDRHTLSSQANNSKALKDLDGLEMSLSKVREENRLLKEMNEELQGQLLNFQLEEGRSLVQEGNKSYSLADEMGDIDVQRLMKALKEQQDDNARLRKYMDDILLKIVEKNPEILDKTMASCDKSHQNESTSANS